MDWHSEAAILWLPRCRQADASEFIERPTPGSSDFFHYAVDAFASIYDRIESETELEPWVYLLEEQSLLPPDQVHALRADWETATGRGVRPGGQ